MSREIRCLVGRTHGELALPRGWPSIGGKTLAEHFAEGSRPSPERRGSIRLRHDASRLEEPVGDERASGATSLDLHRSLRRLLGRSRSDVGVLFARRFEPHPGVFGFMFDTGRSPALDPASPYRRWPREGCAVFTDTIRGVRRAEGWDEERIDREISFTAVHELGHVFNLWHLDRGDDPASFMRSSARHPAAIDDERSFRFVDGSPPREHQREFLSQCHRSRFVTPRGSLYGERGDLGPQGDGTWPASDDAARTGLELRASVTPREFTTLEPVELDLELHPAVGAAAWLEVPDEVDPGYDSLRIDIRTPNGAWRPYRPLRWFCPSARRVAVSTVEPFRRDVSVFFGAEGPTFRVAGPHVIRVGFRSGDSAWTVAPDVEVEVREERESEPLDAALRAALRSHDALPLLFFREGPRSGKLIDALLDLAARFPASHVAASIHYAVGRSLASHARRERRTDARRALERSAREHLARAADHAALGPRRRENARCRSE